MTIDENAPVIAKAEIEINAKPELVWDIMTAIERWQDWNPDVKWASLEGELSEGTKFQWKAGPGKITSRFQKVERPNLLAWSGKTFGIFAIHIWQMEPQDGRTVVKTEESWDGLIVHIFRKSMQKKLDESINSGLQYLKIEAEKRSNSAQ
jgi:hypothetical protein